MIQKDKHKIVCKQRKDREKAQRIQSIMEAAKKVFADKGYLKATMNEIAFVAEVTKPTVYLYFKAKEDLFFALMLPLIDDARQQLQKVKKNLLTGNIHDGRSLIMAIFRALYHGYESSPETFRIIQLFQQNGLMGELKPEVRTTLNDKSRFNFILCRQLLTYGAKMGYIKKVNVCEMGDVIWGLLVGIIQLENAKHYDRKNRRLTKNTLCLAEMLIAEAMMIKAEGRKNTSDKRRQTDHTSKSRRAIIHDQIGIQKAAR